MREIVYYRDSKNNLMAIVIPDDYSSSDITFLTDDNSFFQLAYMGHPKNHLILPHYHNRVERTIDYTTETLVIKKGIVQVSLYENKAIIHQFEAKKGDIVTLFSGGHSFLGIEDYEMVEIKQGPFMGPNDKTRF